jgi:saccharopine dehydrogenase-like NADP-dependent oxidoreductase
MRALVVGAGATGARVARQLATIDGAVEVRLRDVRADRLAAVARSLGSAVVPEMPPFPARVEADVVVLATPPGVGVPIAARAVADGAHVVALTDSLEDIEDLRALDGAARSADVSVLVGAGFAPGLTCLLAAYSAGVLDAVDEIHVAKVGTGGPACARVHHRALGRTASEWRDGAWVEHQGGSGRELCWFPDPVAGRDCYRAALPDPMLLQAAIPGVERITARMSATRRDRLTAHLPMLRPPHPEGGLGAIRVEIRGRLGGAVEVRVFGAIDRPAVAAGIVAAAAARATVLGRARRTGAGGLAEMLEPRRALRDLARRGVRAAVFEGHRDR